MNIANYTGSWSFLINAKSELGILSSHMDSGSFLFVKFQGTWYIYKGDNSIKTQCSVPFWKGVFSIRKEFAPIRSKFFPYRVDLFSEVASQLAFFINL